MIKWIKRNHWIEAVVWIVVFVAAIWACKAHGQCKPLQDQDGTWLYPEYYIPNPYVRGEYPWNTIKNPYFIPNGVERSILVKRRHSDD